MRGKRRRSCRGYSRKRSAQAFGAVNANQVIIRDLLPYYPFGYRQRVRAAPQQINLDQMGLADEDLSLLGLVGIASWTGVLVVGTQHFQHRHNPLAAVSIEYLRIRFVHLQSGNLDFESFVVDVENGRASLLRR